MSEVHSLCQIMSRFKEEKAPTLNFDVDEDAPHNNSRNGDRTQFFFIFTLSGTVPTTRHTWLIDSGTSTPHLDI